MPHPLCLRPFIVSTVISMFLSYENVFSISYSSHTTATTTKKCRLITQPYNYVRFTCYFVSLDKGTLFLMTL